MLFPCNKYILCREVDSAEEDKQTKVMTFTDFKKQMLKEYEVIESSSELCKKGDIVLADSDGTMFDNEDEKQLVFSEKSIIGKIKQENENEHA